MGMHTRNITVLLDLLDDYVSELPMVEKLNRVVGICNLFQCVRQFMPIDDVTELVHMVGIVVDPAPNAVWS